MPLPQVSETLDREYPRMLYNKEGGQLIVQNRFEMQDAIMAGWSTSRTGLTEEEVLLLKIEEAEEVLADLKGKLVLVRGEVVGENLLASDTEVVELEEEEVPTPVSEPELPELREHVVIPPKPSHHKKK